MRHALATKLDFGRGLQTLINTVAHAIPKIAVFVLILAVGVFVAWLAGRLTGKGLHRFGFNRLAERGAVGQALSRGKWDASTLVGKIVYYTMVLFVLQMAFGVFGQNPISVLLTGVIAWLPKAIAAIAIIIIASAIAKLVRDLVNNAIGGLSYGPFLASAASAVIVVLGVLAALNQTNIATSVTEPVLVAALATAGAIAAIGVGGGLIKPMQSRWERILDSAERETIRQVAAYQSGRRKTAARAAGGTERTRIAPAAGQGGAGPGVSRESARPVGGLGQAGSPMESGQIGVPVDGAGQPAVPAGAGQPAVPADGAGQQPAVPSDAAGQPAVPADLGQGSGPAGGSSQIGPT